MCREIERELLPANVYLAPYLGVHMSENGAGRNRRLREATRRPYSFYLDAVLVERARQEVGEGDVIRSIEAALAAAIDYKIWQQELAAGQRDVLS